MKTMEYLNIFSKCCVNMMEDIYYRLQPFCATAFPYWPYKYTFIMPSTLKCNDLFYTINSNIWSAEEIMKYQLDLVRSNFWNSFIKSLELLSLHRTIYSENNSIKVLANFKNLILDFAQPCIVNLSIPSYVLESSGITKYYPTLDISEHTNSMLPDMCAVIYDIKDAPFLNFDFQGMKSFITAMPIALDPHGVLYQKHSNFTYDQQIKDYKLIDNISVYNYMSFVVPLQGQYNIIKLIHL